MSPAWRLKDPRLIKSRSTTPASGGKAKFICTIPDQSLAPKISAPAKINGSSVAIPISDWQDAKITPERVDQIIKAIPE